MFKRLVLLALFTLTAACGSIKEGDACSTENSGACEDSTTVLLCESSTLHAYKCKGTGGCVSNGNGASCDFSGSVAGDACPKINDTKALCDSHDANSALLCTGGVWTSKTCNACSVQSGNVVCGK